MNIIDKWRQMTTCRNCCKGKTLMTIKETGQQVLLCGADPGAYPIVVAEERCDKGMWLFRGKSPGVIGGPYEIPFDLKDWLELRVGMNPDGYTLIPREEWAEVEP